MDENLSHLGGKVGHLADEMRVIAAMVDTDWHRGQVGQMYRMGEACRADLTPWPKAVATLICVGRGQKGG